jgi:REP element-mobilizing transposase RayT
MYHVVNRGNYRRDLFESVGAATAFLKTLEEACTLYRWKLYAYALMRNHYHLVIETVEPNLVDGMHWMQCTYSTRFNRYRTERGHVFQGRYHAGIIENPMILGHIVDYVHLNPVKAGIMTADKAANFRWSSLGRFVRGLRLPSMEAQTWLVMRGLQDNKTGWISYQEHLCELAGNLEEQKRLGWDGFSYGWAHGSESWRKEMANEHKQHALDPGIEAGQLKELKDLQWQDHLNEALARAGRKVEDLQTGLRSAEWKLRIALQLRKDHGIAIWWLAERLCLGKPNSARSLLWRTRNAN